MRLQIGFSGFVLQGGKSGIATYCQQLLEALAPLAAIKVFTTAKDAALLSSNLEIRRSPNWVGNPIVNILWHHTALPWAVLRDGLEVVHIPSIRRVPLIKAGPMVATVHDLAPLVIPDKYDSYRHFYHNQVLRRAIHRCDRIISVSRNTKADLMRLLGVPEEKIVVIYPGIDHLFKGELDRAQALKLLQGRYQLSKRFIVYVSRLEHPGKNHERLLEAFALYKDRHGGNLQLVLAGADWSGSKHIRACAARNTYRQDIHFLGYVSDETIKALYAACDLMIYPSLYEGFGLPLLEAMACGARVVCSNTSSMLELADGRVPLFDPRSVRAICEGIEKGLQAPWDAEALRAYAMGFTWEKAASETLKVYQDAARQSGA